MLSYVRLFVIPWTAACQAPLSSTLPQNLLKLRSIESVMLSNHLILRCPLLLPSIFPNIRVFSNESALCIMWPKHWGFSFSISPSNEYLGLISFRKGKSEIESHSVVSESLRPHGRYNPGILQGRILEWVAVSFSRRYFQPRD